MSLDNITHIKVFPGIGTARVGNSPEYFIGPEFPGDVPNLGKPYKDENGYLKPQAARFRVYGYDAEGNVVAEITHDPTNGTTLEWDVHMRNLKAANYAFQGKFGFNPDQYRNPGVTPNTSGTDPNSRSSLIIDPGARTISGVNQNGANAKQLDGGKIFSGIGTAKIPTTLLKKGEPGTTEVTYNEKEVSLGRLETDDAGRLIVVGGKGEAGCLIEPPIILQKGVSTFNGTNVQIGDEQPDVPYSGSVPNTFYSKETKNVEIQALDQTSIYLSSTEDGTGSVAVYDELTISVNDNQVYCHDFRNASGKVIPKPHLDITEALAPYRGQTVNLKIECITHGNEQGASAFWLTYINENPTSNGNSYFNNPGWYDDTSGGSVNAKVTINGTTFSTKDTNGKGDVNKRGWVAVSPPKYVPTMNNVVSLLDLQLNMFPEEDPVSGTVNFASIDSSGLPSFSSGGSSINLTPLSGVTAQGQDSPSIASYNGKDYFAYRSTSGEYLIAVSTDNGATWTESAITAVDSNGFPFVKTTKYAPSLCVFDGVLTYIVVVEQGGLGGTEGYLYIGSSTDGQNFTFVEANPGGGVTGIGVFSRPNATVYNGQLYISYAGSDNTAIIAHRYLKPSTNDYFYTFNALSEKVYEGTSPALGVFFGQLYCAYTGTDCNAYLGAYNNYAPSPAEPATVAFNFNQVNGAPTSKLSPSIGASHGKLYYAIIDESSNLQLGKAAPAPVLDTITFTSQGAANTSSSIAIANFSDISFYRDVYPVLKTVTDYAWVNEPAYHGHAPGKPGDFLRKGSLKFYDNPVGDKSNFYRTFVFNFLRQPEQLTPLVPPPPYAIPNPTNEVVNGIQPSIPDGGIQSGSLMPHLFGEGGSTLENNFNGTNYPNQWLSLTPHQLWKFQEWVNGNFTAYGTGIAQPAPTKFEDIPLVEQPAALNFSALEPTVGGGFHPGIELTYYMKEPGFFAEGFRFADAITNTSITDDQKGGIELVAPLITPGSVAGYMSIPWQGDFWSCNISWWAAMRPDIVIPPQEDVPPPFIPWFRGKGVGIPVNADNLDGYEGGYEHMVRYWSDFGFVVPTGATDLGMTVMAETERNACLDNTTTPCTQFNPSEAVHLGVAQAATPSTGSFPDTFYTNTLDIIIPASGDVILSSNEAGTGEIYVDDKCTITMTYTEYETVEEDGIESSKVTGHKTVTIFSHDFSNGNSGRITKLPPVNLTSVISDTNSRGMIVTLTIDYIDLYPGSKGGSDFWLVYPTPPVHLGASQPLAQPQGNLPAPFYTNTVPVNLPAQGKVILSGSSDGTADMKVDNECIIKINGTQVYSNSFGSTVHIPPTASAPVDITSNLESYMGTTVFMEIQYINFNAVSEATDIWLTFEP